MVFDEDLEDLYHAFGDRLERDGKEQKIIICKICVIFLGKLLAADLSMRSAY